MAARVSEAELRKIFKTSATALPSDSALAFINTANLMVNEYLSGSGFSESYLKEIELYLSAHLAAMWDQRRSEKEIGESRFKFQGKWDLGLNSTDYGQKVIILDSTGSLVNAGMSKSVIEQL